MTMKNDVEDDLPSSSSSSGTRTTLGSSATAGIAATIAPQHLKQEWNKSFQHHVPAASMAVSKKKQNLFYEDPASQQDEDYFLSGYDPDDLSSSHYSTTSSLYPAHATNSSSNSQNQNEINSSSHSSKHLHGKLSRARRRASAQTLSRHRKTSRSDCSIASDSSDNSHLNRYSKGLVSRQKHHQHSFASHQYASSSNSLHGLAGSSASLASGTTKHSVTNSAISPRYAASTASVNDNYDKHHHPSTDAASTPSLMSLLYSHQQQGSYAQPLQSPSQPPPPLPSLKVIASELVVICSLYCRYTCHLLQKPCRRIRRRLWYCLLTLTIFVLMLTAWVVFDFYMDAVELCTPPPIDSSHFAAFLAESPPNGNNAAMTSIQNEDGDYTRPLVEYYVHGRGIGHYARSVAIVQQLNHVGIDVRMFLTRAAMWRAMHEDAKSMTMDDEVVVDGEVNEGRYRKRGKTTAISVASITPEQNYADVVSHVVERVTGDCEVSKTSGRYPQLIISDGDFPGMLRAEMGGISSVGIAHGQLFSIAQKPDWVKKNPQLNSAWNEQGTLNYVSGFFTEWQIATHFCFLESRYASGTVARAPLRPEVLQMAEARKFARLGKVPYSHGLQVLPPQAERIEKLLLPDNLGSSINSTAMTKDSAFSGSAHQKDATLPRRKLVICYFRDHNGEIVVQALLDAGFDVLLFDNGYYKDMVNDPTRYGVKWIVKDPEKERKRYIRTDNRRRLSQLTNDTETGTIDHRRLVESLFNNNGGPRLLRVVDRSLFVPLMHVADGVASSAGSQLMSECIYSHMPLLALYREDDDEQRLNVELSHHMDAPCHRPLVFGNSFESLTYALQSNDTHYATHNYRSPILESLAGFIREVRKSRVSETYFRNIIPQSANFSNDAKNQQGGNDPDDFYSEEDPFRGLPDAAAIILEIVKQVIQKG